MLQRLSGQWPAPGHFVDRELQRWEADKARLIYSYSLRQVHRSGPSRSFNSSCFKSMYLMKTSVAVPAAPLALHGGGGPLGGGHGVGGIGGDGHGGDGHGEGGHGGDGVGGGGLRPSRLRPSYAVSTRIRPVSGLFQAVSHRLCWCPNNGFVSAKGKDLLVPKGRIC